MVRPIRSSLLPLALCLFALCVFAGSAGTEPLVGTWVLSNQTVNGQKVDSEALTLRIYPAGDALEFAFSVPINGIHFVSMRFVSVRVNGSAGTVENASGAKIGTVKLLKIGPVEYKTVVEGPNRPSGTNTMTVSPDGKTLTSESDTTVAGKPASHAVQTFSRR